MNCADCGRPIDAETSTVHCSSWRLGCYYAGSHICLHCAHWRYREAAYRADLRELRDHLWGTGAITMGGLERLDRAIGVDTYGSKGE